jgi:hypothetical protein
VRGEQVRASVSLAVLRARLDTVNRSMPGATTPERFPALIATDATALAEWRTPRGELTATATVRRAPRQSADLLGSVYVVGAVRLADRVAATASGGALAADPLRGFPRRRVGTIGMRVSLGSRPASPRAAPSAYPRRTWSCAAGGACCACAPRAGGVGRGARRLHELAGGAARARRRRVGAADRRGAGHAARRAARGRRAWAAPANLPAVEDDFGERSGLLVVP